MNVQSVITPQQFVIAFTKTPDDETVKRTEKQGIQAHSLKHFASMIQLQLAIMSSVEVRSQKMDQQGIGT